MNVPKLREMGVGKRSPSDNLFAAGDTLCRPYVREGVVDVDDETLCHRVMASFPCAAPGCQEVFESLLDFELHHKIRHTIICCECRKPLPSAHLLDLHISESHDSFFAAQAERKPMFRCFVEHCTVVSKDAADRKAHCVEAHAFPTDFRYDESHKKKKKKGAENNKSAGLSGAESMSVDEVTKHLNKFTFGHSHKKMFSRKLGSGRKAADRNYLIEEDKATFKNGVGEKSDGESSIKTEKMEF